MLFFAAESSKHHCLRYKTREWVCAGHQVDVDAKALPPGLICLPPGSSDSQLSSLAMSSDGKLLAAGSSDGTVSRCPRSACLF
jgi:WD40 repeat protein